VTGTTFLPLLAPAPEDPPGDPAGPVLDEFVDGLGVAYSFGPPYGDRLVSWLDLDRLSLSRRLAASVAGDLVVGVPARDVVVVTGSQSQEGLAKARSAVDRVFSAGDQYLLARTLLVRRDSRWAALRD
jgi:hypothetical protein